VAATLAEDLEQLIADRHGFRPQVLVLSRDELRRAVTANPFAGAETDPRRVHLFFLAQPATTPDLPAVAQLKSDRENYQLNDRVFYLHAPDGIGRSRLAARVERCLGVATTARNSRTVFQVLAMATAD